MKYSLTLVAATAVFLSYMVVNSLAYASPSESASGLAVDVSLPDTLRTNLEKLQGKSVTLRVAGGDELTGIVNAVGPSAVQLSKLSGKEFFDAVVPLEKVVAVIVRAR